MSVRVRFAPSPTGYLHIGGARTALYNLLYARATGGTFVVRIEDTDLERSSKEFEESQMEDLKWLGLMYDEGPEKPGAYGPYRQSERMDIYKEYALKLVEKGLAFYDFCTDEELEAMKEKAEKEGALPYTGKWRNKEFFAEAKKRVEAGESAPIRFKAIDKDYTFYDHVRGEITFPKGMVGDFVILRSNGMPTYNFCNVVDDSLQKITHVIRGEDHVNNTLRQLMLYEAFGVKHPEYAHVSLLIGQDRQKLSKRHGATSVRQYKEDSYLPESLTNYLCHLGWSHPEEKDIFKLEELKNIFNLDRFSKSHAIYDIEKLKWVNSQHLRQLSNEDLLKRVGGEIKNSYFKNQSDEWKLTCLNLFKDKAHLTSEIEKLIEEQIVSEDIHPTEALKEILSWETTPKIIQYLRNEISKLSAPVVSGEELDKFMEVIKKEMGIKGKPLFMGVRAALTGADHGADLKILIPLVKRETLLKRLTKIEGII